MYHVEFVVEKRNFFFGDVGFEIKFLSYRVEFYQLVPLFSTSDH